MNTNEHEVLAEMLGEHKETDWSVPLDGSQSSLQDPPETPPGENTDTPTYPQLLETVNRLRAELNQRVMTDKLTSIARDLKIPESVIVTDLALFADRFVLQDGVPVLASDPTKTAKATLAALQEERLHWQPTSQGGGSMMDIRRSGVVRDADFFTKR